MTKIINNTLTTIITKVEKKTTAIRTGLIKGEDGVGMMLFVNEQEESEPVMQLQFDNLEDIEYTLNKLTNLKQQMEMAKNG